jgi:hypothetical protein
VLAGEVESSVGEVNVFGWRKALYSLLRQTFKELTEVVSHIVDLYPVFLFVRII